MITEKMLKQAAAEADQAIRDSLPPPETCRHEFSPQFQEKIRRISRRADHPVLYKLPKRAACFLLAALLAGCAWLTVDAEARAAFVGWIKQAWNEFTAYYFTGENPAEQDTPEYYLSWLPEGYRQVTATDLDGAKTILYENDAGQLLEFNFMPSSSETYWFIDTSKTTHRLISIGGVPADLYISQVPEVASAVVWMSADEETAFYISAFLDEAGLIRLVENIKIK